MCHKNQKSHCNSESPLLRIERNIENEREECLKVIDVNDA